MAATCPRDGTPLTELDRSGVRIDACRENVEAYGLDRGELDKILEQEAAQLDSRDQEDEAFLREMAGGSQARGDDRRDHRSEGPGFDKRTAERIFEEYKSYKKGSHSGYGGHSGYGKKRKKSFLEQLLD